MRGTAGWMFTTFLVLVGLQALTNRSAPGRVASLFSDVNNLLNRALDPTIPAIPDRSATSSTPAAAAPAPTATTSPVVYSVTGTRRTTA